MAKRSHPALYEVINKKGPLVPAKSTATAPTPSSTPAQTPSQAPPATPGRVGDPAGPGSTAESKPEGGSSADGNAARTEGSGTSAGSWPTGAMPVHAHPPSTGAAHTRADPRSETSPIDLAALLTPGRLVRLPVGYVWISIGAIIAAVVLSYVVGHASGRRMVERERDLDLATAVAAAERGLNGSGVARDPLRSGTDTPADARSGAGRTATGGGADGGLGGGGGGAAGRTTPGQTSGAAVPTGDPRVAGHHYYVLAHGTEEGAPRMAAFLRENGVDARVVTDHNGRLRKVIALPGLAERADQSTPAATALRASIEEGLRKWRQSTGDRSRRSPDYYLEQHGAQPRR